MTEPITCNYARVAIHHFTTKHMNTKYQLPRGSYTKILQDYNKHFEDTPSLKATYSVVSKKFLSITHTFKNKWRPHKTKVVFISKFSPEAWKRLDSTVKSGHSLCGCHTCSTVHELESKSFPLSSKAHEKVKPKCSAISLTFTPNELATPERFGSTLIAKADQVCQEKFQKPVQTVLTETPRSRLVTQPNHRTRLHEKRKILREIKNTPEKDMHTDSDMVVLQNRISWDNLIMYGKHRVSVAPRDKQR